MNKLLFAEGGQVDKQKLFAGLAGALDQMEAPVAPGDGGLISGPGGGLEDAIPASIDGEQPAALSDGEFVVPADVVAMIGDGSTEAGSRRLMALIEQIRIQKQGTPQQAPSLSGLA